MADSEQTRDWLVSFTRKVAEQRQYSADHPGYVPIVMLRMDEAEGLLKEIQNGYARNADGSCVTPEQTDEGCVVPVTVREHLRAAWDEIIEALTRFWWA